MEDKNKEMIDKADKLYDEEKYEEAFEIYKPLAEGGDLHAMWRLGLMYDRGKSIKQDYQEAFRWYEKAAQQGFADAQLNLGFMYASGVGIKQDEKEGLKWIKKAAEHGDKKMQGYVGRIFINGLKDGSVKKDRQEGLKWLTKAAERGDAAAMAFLGLGCFFTSTDQESDKWYQKAANQYAAEAKFALAKKLYNGDVKQDYQEAFKQCQKAAKKRHADAQYMLAMMYQDGKGIGQDHKEAVKWLIKAAWKGNAKAQSMLRQTYSEADIKQAHQQLLDEADRLNKKEKYEAALEIYEPLADESNAHAMISLGYMYWDGLGVIEDFQKGFKLIQKAAEQGNEEAQQCLRNIDFDGKDIPENLEEYVGRVTTKMAKNIIREKAERGDMSKDEADKMLGALDEAADQLKERLRKQAQKEKNNT